MNNSSTQLAFETQGYCVIRSAISNELRDFITQYALFDEMQDFTPEKRHTPIDQALVAEAHSKYADPAMETLLLHLHAAIEQAVGLTLWPTYSYYRVYRNGDDLAAHKDRPSCEISATICLNFNYETNDAWPISMQDSEIQLQPGDMAIYRGCEILHQRNKLNIDPDHWHVQAFVHYVDVDGPYSAYKWDGRSSVGLLPQRAANESSDSHQQNMQFEKTYIKYIG